MFTSNKKKNLLFQDNTEKLLPLRNNCTAQVIIFLLFEVYRMLFNKNFLTKLFNVTYGRILKANMRIFVCDFIFLFLHCNLKRNFRNSGLSFVR